MTKINEDFEFSFACEEAKKSFQAQVASLHEVAILLKGKTDSASRNGKAGIFFSTTDAEILFQWIMNAVINVQTEFNTLDRINRKSMGLYAAAQSLSGQCTCKHLIHADRFLSEWEAHKQSKIKAA
jgi:hypothetical protein